MHAFLLIPASSTTLSRPCSFLSPPTAAQVWSLTNIFSAPHSPQRPYGERDDLVPAGLPPPPVLATGPSAWLYFNLLITQSQARCVAWLCCLLALLLLALGPPRAAPPNAALSQQAASPPCCARCAPSPQIFIPVYDVAPAQELSSLLWSGSGDGDKPSGFDHVGGMALACVVLRELEEAEERLSLEDRGLALSATALRFAYSAGGDGESNLKASLGRGRGAGQGDRRVAWASPDTSCLALHSSHLTAVLLNPLPSPNCCPPADRPARHGRLCARPQRPCQLRDAALLHQARHRPQGKQAEREGSERRQRECARVLRGDALLSSTPAEC